MNVCSLFSVIITFQTFEWNYINFVWRLSEDYLRKEVAKYRLQPYLTKCIPHEVINSIAIPIICIDHTLSSCLVSQIPEFRFISNEAGIQTQTYSLNSVPIDVIKGHSITDVINDCHINRWILQLFYFSLKSNVIYNYQWLEYKNQVGILYFIVLKFHNCNFYTFWNILNFRSTW